MGLKWWYYLLQNRLEKENTLIMRIEIKRQDCPKFSTEVSDCALCVKRYFASSEAYKPCCFQITEEPGADLVVTVRNGDFFMSTAPEQPRQISCTDWLS